MTIDEIEEQINYLSKCKAALVKPMVIDQNHFVENVLRIYIETEKLSGVLEYIKEKGYTKSDGGKYSSNDVSGIIDGSREGILSDVAKKILKKNRGAVNRRFN